MSRMTCKSNPDCGDVFWNNDPTCFACGHPGTVAHTYPSFPYSPNLADQWGITDRIDHLF